MDWGMEQRAASDQAMASSSRVSREEERCRIGKTVALNLIRETLEYQRELKLFKVWSECSPEIEKDTSTSTMNKHSQKLSYITYKSCHTKNQDLKDLLYPESSINKGIAPQKGTAPLVNRNLKNNLKFESGLGNI